MPVLIVVAPEVALAAIATAFALVAQMIGTSVFGAVDANFGGGLVANIALESEGLSHESDSLRHFAGAAAAGFGVAAAGLALNEPRQRCASVSTILNSCSFVCARSLTYCRN